MYLKWTFSYLSVERASCFQKHETAFWGSLLWENIIGRKKKNKGKCLEWESHKEQKDKNVCCRWSPFWKDWRSDALTSKTDCRCAFAGFQGILGCRLLVCQTRHVLQVRQQLRLVHMLMACRFKWDAADTVRGVRKIRPWHSLFWSRLRSF